jgi:hypothetical protein
MNRGVSAGCTIIRACTRGGQSRPLQHSRVERFGDFPGDLESVLERELLLPPDSIPEGLPLDIGHDVIQEAVGGARVVQWQDVGMLKARLDADFAEEPLGAQRGGPYPEFAWCWSLLLYVAEPLAARGYTA